jgi:hypothetical protein
MYHVQNNFTDLGNIWYGQGLKFAECSDARRPDRLWGPRSLLSNGCHGSFLRDKATGA